MELDSYTILIAGTAVLVLQGLAFVLFWLLDRKSIWLLMWGSPFILAGVAILFYTRPGWSNDFASIAYGNALRMIALLSLWQGIRVFQGRRVQIWPGLAVGLGWIALCLYQPFLESLLARVVVVSLVMSGTCFLAVHELWRERADPLPSRRPLMIVFSSFGILLLVRSFSAASMPFPFGITGFDGRWLAAFMFLVFAHASFAGLLFFSLTRERREAEQRNFALSDPLTGLLNRRAFGDFADRMARRRTAARHELALLVLDLDHFKQINDRYGHEVGDRMLKAFADTAEACVRPTDQLFRMGGEEFCFVLPETSLNDAVAIAERIRKAFESIDVETTVGLASATVSIGIAASQFAVELDVLLAAADAAVYEAKARGRNRVVVAEPGTLRGAGQSSVAAPERRRSA